MMYVIVGLLVIICFSLFYIASLIEKLARKFIPPTDW